MSTCDDCKWWNSPKLYRDGKEGMGNLWIYELGECLINRLRENPFRRPEDSIKVKPNDFATTPDYAKLATGPKFGCVHFEKKS